MKRQSKFFEELWWSLPFQNQVSMKLEIKKRYAPTSASAGGNTGENRCVQFPVVAEREEQSNNL